MKKTLLLIGLLFIVCSNYDVVEVVDRENEEIPGWDIYGSRVVYFATLPDQYHQMTIINEYNPGDICLDTPVLDCCAALWLQIAPNEYWYLWAWSGEQMSDMVPAQGVFWCEIVISLYDVYGTHTEYFDDTISFYQDMTLIITGEGRDVSYHWEE